MSVQFSYGALYAPLLCIIITFTVNVIIVVVINHHR